MKYGVFYIMNTNKAKLSLFNNLETNTVWHFYNQPVRIHN